MACSQNNFLSDLPQWHQSYFPNWQEHTELDPTTSEDSITLAIGDVARIMDVTTLCLLLFPFPGSEELRESFKNSIVDAVRINGLKLHNRIANMNSYDVPWYHWGEVDISFDELSNAAYRGWLYSSGLYVPIWERYIREREQPFMELYQQERESLGLTENNNAQASAPQQPDTPKPYNLVNQNSKYIELFREAYQNYWQRYGKQPNHQTFWINLPDLCPEYKITISKDEEGQDGMMVIPGIGNLTPKAYKRQFSKHFPALP